MFLWHPAASQVVWLITPTPGRMFAVAGRASGRRQAQKPVKRELYSRTRGSKDGLDEPKGFISGKEPFGYHPEMGGYPDLYNHLLAVATALCPWVHENGNGLRRRFC